MNRQELLYLDRAMVVNVLLLSFVCHPRNCLYERKAKGFIDITCKIVLTLSSEDKSS